MHTPGYTSQLSVYVFFGELCLETLCPFFFFFNQVIVLFAIGLYILNVKSVSNT